MKVYVDPAEDLAFVEIDHPDIELRAPEATRARWLVTADEAVAAHPHAAGWAVAAVLLRVAARRPLHDAQPALAAVGAWMREDLAAQAMFWRIVAMAEPDAHPAVAAALLREPSTTPG